MATGESQSASASPPPADPRRQALVNSLRSRYRSAEERQDATAKQGLFKEAVYLGIQPAEFTGPD